MLVSIIDFKGAVPRLNPRLLPNNYAQIARNTRLERGTAEPVKLPRLEATLGVAATTFYRHQSTWLSWPSVVDAAPGPVDQNRLYYTGDGAPKMRVGVNIFPLALAKPAAAPTLTALSAINPAKAESIVYCYTYVTSFGEESQPSPVATIQWSPGVIIRLSAFSAAPGGRSIISRRIYRSETSAAGVTGLYFVAEIPIATATYDHDIATAPLAELLPSMDYDPPIATLHGLIPLPNGMMAAFDGKDIWFCEPYQPHAWPAKYSLTVDYDIIGGAAFGSVLAVLTTGTPYILQGTHPENMAMERMDKALPCLSRRGIVDIGYACYYPSGEGLALVSASQSDIVTRKLFTREEWQNLSPDTIVAESFNGRYHFAYNFANYDTYDGGTAAVTGANGLDGGDASGSGGPITAFDFGSAGSSFGSRRMGSIDLIGDMPYFIEADTMLPDALFAEQSSGNLYGLVGGTQIMEWDDAGSPLATQIWRSKKFVFPYPTNFGAALIQTDSDLSAGDALAVRFIADGAVTTTLNVSNVAARLASGFEAREWQIEIEGNVSVTAILMAHTMDELEAGL